MACLSDRAALMRAILEAPDDDRPRLIFADWCDENGRPVEADRVRKGVSSGWIGWRVPGIKIDGDRMLWPGVMRRGFRAEVELTAADFLAHAADLFSAHPITEVRLTDKWPNPRHYPDRGCAFGWWGSDADWSQWIEYDIPLGIAGAFADQQGNTSWFWYPTVDDALAALSRACVAFGRDLVGLPEYIPHANAR
jgi:uncharacterized protein (TIGR02996 family)